MGRSNRNRPPRPPSEGVPPIQWEAPCNDCIGAATLQRMMRCASLPPARPPSGEEAPRRSPRGFGPLCRPLRGSQISNLALRASAVERPEDAGQLISDAVKKKEEEEKKNGKKEGVLDNKRGCAVKKEGVRRVCGVDL